MDHYYRVELIKRVVVPRYGPYAYSLSVKQKDSHFGKGKEFKTGKLALAAATEFAQSMWDSASSIHIIRMIGKNGYDVSYIKNDIDLYFNKGWKEE